MWRKVRRDPREAPWPQDTSMQTPADRRPWAGSSPRRRGPKAPWPRPVRDPRLDRGRPAPTRPTVPRARSSGTSPEPRRTGRRETRGRQASPTRRRPRMRRTGDRPPRGGPSGPDRRLLGDRDARPGRRPERGKRRGRRAEAPRDGPARAAGRPRRAGWTPTGRPSGHLSEPEPPPRHSRRSPFGKGRSPRAIAAARPARRLGAGASWRSSSQPG